MPRKLLIASLFALGAAAASAAVVPKISYQGYLREGGGLAVGTKTMVFKLFASSTTTSALWTSASQSVAVSTGLFHVVLEPVGVDWEANNVWLELEVNGVTLLPREELTTSPYAVNTLYHGGKRYLTAATAPTSPVTGDLWLDSSAGGVLKFWTGTAWATTSGAGLPGAHAATHAGAGADPLTGVGALTVTGNATYASGVSLTSAGDGVRVSTNLLVTSGNLGVGTSAPGARLDVRGDSRFGSTTQSTFTAAGALNVASGQNITLFGGTVTGLADPAGASDAATRGWVLASAGASAGGWNRASGVVSPTNTTDSVAVHSTFTVQGDAFSVGTSTLAVRSGRLGVGTASPAVPLDVEGAAQFGSSAKSTFTAAGALALAAGQGIALSGGGKLTGLADPTADADAAPRKWVLDNVASGSGWTRTGAAIAPTNLGDPVTIGSTLTVQGNAFSVGESTFVVAGGFVGIGTASPGAALTLGSGFGNSHELRFGTSDATANLKRDAGIGGLATSGTLRVDGQQILLSKNDGYLGFNDSAQLRIGRTLAGQLELVAGAAARATLTQSGSLGLGTASPTARLHVSSAGAVAADTLFLVSSGTAQGQELFSIKGDGRIILGSTVTFSAAVAGTSASFLQNTVAPSVSANLNADVSLGNENARWIAVGSDGFARLVFFDNANTDLKFARCTNADCTSANVTVIATVAQEVFGPVIALGSDGFARVAYVNFKTPNELRFVRCTNADCTTRVDTLVDSANSDMPDGAYWTIGLALGSDGFARIVYDNYDSGAQGVGVSKIRLARCADADCTTKTLTIAVTGLNWLETSAIVMGDDGFPRLAYGAQGPSPQQLHFVQCSNDTCSANTDTVVETSAAYYYLDLDKAADGFGLIAYSSPEGLKLARCTNAACTAKSIVVIDASARMAADWQHTSQVSLRTGADGFPRITYNTSDAIGAYGGQRYVRCRSADCSDRTKALLGSGGYPSSLALGPDGLARVAFVGYDGRTILVVRLASDAGTSSVSGASIGSGSVPYGEAAITRVASQEVQLSGGSQNALSVSNAQGEQVFALDTSTSPPTFRGSVAFNDRVTFKGPQIQLMRSDGDSAQSFTLRYGPGGLDISGVGGAGSAAAVNLNGPGLILTENIGGGTVFRGLQASADDSPRDLALMAGSGRGVALVVNGGPATVAGAPFYIDGSGLVRVSGHLQVHDSKALRMFSDSGVTQTGLWNSATGAMAVGTSNLAGGGTLIVRSTSTSNVHPVINLQNENGTTIFKVQRDMKVAMGEPLSSASSFVDIVRGGDPGAAPLADAVLSVRSNSHTGINVLGPTNANLGLYLGNTTDGNIAQFGYGDSVGIVTIGADANKRVDLIVESQPVVTLATSRNVGVRETAPYSTMTVAGALGLSGIGQPDGNAAGRGILYFDSTAGKFKVSENGGAYAELATNASAARVYQHSVAVTAGNTKPLSRFRSFPEGPVSVLIQVQSKTGGHSGTRLYLFQGGYEQLGTTYPGSWYKMRPLEEGRGHGDSTAGFDLYVRAGSDGYEYDFGAAAVTNNKNLVVTFTDLTGGDTARTDLSAGGETASSSAGNVSSRHSAVFGDTAVGDGYWQIKDAEFRHLFGAETAPRVVMGRDMLGSGLPALAFKQGGAGTVAADGGAVGQPASDTLAFYTSNGAALTERARIDGSGNVGVSNTAPQGRLHVSSGAVYIDGDASTFRVGPSTFAILANGRVGVGTASPEDGLHLIGQFRIDNDSNSTFKGCIGFNGASNRIEWSDDCTTFQGFGSGWTDGGTSVYTTAPGDRVGINQTTPQGLLHVSSGAVYVDGDIATFRVGPSTFAVRADGNIGIGTASPSHRLDVSGGGLILRSSMTLAEMAAPPASEAGRGAIYFDSTAKKFKVSENGGAYSDLAGVRTTGDTMTGQLTVSGASATVTDALGVGGVGLTGGTVVARSTSATAAHSVLSLQNAAGAELLRVQNDGAIGIGGLPGTWGSGTTGLFVEKTGVDIESGVQARVIISPVDAGRFGYGSSFTAESPAANAQNLSYLIGSWASGNHSGSGVVDDLYGAEFVAMNSGAGTATRAQGVDAWAWNQAGGALADAHGLRSWVQNDGAGTVTNAHGLRVRSAVNSGGGAITNNYGLYLEEQTVGANDWNLYSLGGRNYFSGGVGLGNESPQGKLHVSSGAVYIDGDAASFRVGQSTFSVWPTGAVGFGSPSPPGFTNGEGIEVSRAPSQVASTVRVNLQGVSAGEFFAKASNVGIGSVSNTPLALVTNNSSRLTIDADGNVGIGTAGPAAKLHMSSGTLLVDGDASTAFRVGASTLVVLGSGNVGVGTTSPGAQFAVERGLADTNSRQLLAQFSRATTGAAAAGIGGSFEFTAEDNAGNQRQAAVMSWDLSDVSAASPAGRLYLGTRGAQEAITILNGGNVGIGTTDPSVHFEVKGTNGGTAVMGLDDGTNKWRWRIDGGARLQWMLDGSDKGSLSSAGVFTDASDASKKKDVADLRYGLEELLQLRPRSYRMKDTGSAEIGFIAQEVEKIVPEVVSGEEGRKGLAYGHLTPVLVQGVKELVSRLEALEARAQAAGPILKAADGPNCFRVTVNNAGAVSTAPVSCP